MKYIKCKQIFTGFAYSLKFLRKLLSNCGVMKNSKSIVQQSFEILNSNLLSTPLRIWFQLRFMQSIQTDFTHNAMQFRCIIHSWFWSCMGISLMMVCTCNWINRAVHYLRIQFEVGVYACKVWTEASLRKIELIFYFKKKNVLHTLSLTRQMCKGIDIHVL